MKFNIKKFRFLQQTNVQLNRMESCAARIKLRDILKLIK